MNNRFYGDDPVALTENIYAPDISAIMQSSNLYVYCLNDPILFFDYFGLEVTKDTPPTEQDGYIAPKDGPKTGKDKNGNKGWMDKNGNIWVPVPDGTPQAHGGGHWDVQRPDGKGYVHRYPGGKERKGSGRAPVLPKGVENNSSDSQIFKVMINRVTSVGVGYILYRVVRLIPSLIPPFYWTLPANLATP